MGGRKKNPPWRISPTAEGYNSLTAEIIKGGSKK